MDILQIAAWYFAVFQLSRRTAHSGFSGILAFSRLGVNRLTETILALAQYVDPCIFFLPFPHLASQVCMPLGFSQAYPE